MSTGSKVLQPLEDVKLDEYLNYVSSGALNKAQVLSTLSQPSGRLRVLSALIRYHTSKIPWSSLAFHYLPTRGNTLNPDDIFHKLVNRRLGGHCLEFAILFASVLRALGYDFYFIGARIGPSLTFTEGFHGWSHTVLIITIDENQYVVDPQYQYICEPVLLDPDQTPIIFNSIPTSVVRLRHVPLRELVKDGASTSGLMTWVFDYKYHPENQEWLPPQYIFSTQTEWFLEDLEVMNAYLNEASTSYLRQNIFLRRMLLASEMVTKGQSGADPVDDMIPAPSGLVHIVNDTFQVWQYGRKIHEQQFKFECERVEIMKKWFDVYLTPEEISSAQGWGRALPWSASDADIHSTQAGEPLELVPPLTT